LVFTERADGPVQETIHEEEEKLSDGRVTLYMNYIKIA